MTKDVQCPVSFMSATFRSASCIRDDCAWYSPENEACIVFALGSLADAVQDLRDRLTNRPNPN